MMPDRKQPRRDARSSASPLRESSPKALPPYVGLARTVRPECRVPFEPWALPLLALALLIAWLAVVASSDLTSISKAALPGETTEVAR